MCNYHLNCTYLSHLSSWVHFFPLFLHPFYAFNCVCHDLMVMCVHKHVKQTPQSMYIPKRTYDHKPLKETSMFSQSSSSQPLFLVLVNGIISPCWVCDVRTSKLIQPLMHFKASTTTVFFFIDTSQTRCLFALSPHSLPHTLYLSHSQLMRLLLLFAADICESRLTNWMKFICLASFVWVFACMCFTHTLSAESCVGNKPHNQFIITLCIGWMRMVRAKHGERWSSKRKSKHKEQHSTSKHTHTLDA